MILGVAKDRVPFIRQRRHNARIRRKPRWKNKRRLRTLKLSQSPLQLRMRFAPPANKRTSPAAPTLALTRDSRRFNQPLIRCQSEIIIRSEVDQLATIEHNPCTSAPRSARQAAAATPSDPNRQARRRSMSAGRA